LNNSDFCSSVIFRIDSGEVKLFSFIQAVKDSKVKSSSQPISFLIFADNSQSLAVSSSEILLTITNAALVNLSSQK
jgi:hypothetical protein